jgi:hypothetical protein
MKNIKQLQTIINETDRELNGIDYQNRNQAIETALAKLQNQPQLLREIVTNAINHKAHTNVARDIERLLKA